MQGVQSRRFRNKHLRRRRIVLFQEDTTAVAQIEPGADVDRPTSHSLFPGDLAEIVVHQPPLYMFCHRHRFLDQRFPALSLRQAAGDLDNDRSIIAGCSPAGYMMIQWWA